MYPRWDSNYKLSAGSFHESWNVMWCHTITADMVVPLESPLYQIHCTSLPPFLPHLWFFLSTPQSFCLTFLAKSSEPTMPISSRSTVRRVFNAQCETCTASKRRESCRSIDLIQLEVAWYGYWYFLDHFNAIHALIPTLPVWMIFLFADWIELETQQKASK